MNRLGSSRRRAATIVAALLIAVLGISSVLAQALGPAGPSPAQQHSAVVTHALVDIAEGDHVWRIRNLQVDADMPSLSADVPAFLTTEGVPILVEQPASGLRQRVAPGEAAVVPEGNEASLTSLGPPQSVMVVDILPVENATLSGSPGGISDPFEMEAGTYDVDVIRVQLLDGESTTVPMGNGPSLIVTRSGQSNVGFENADDILLGSGSGHIASGEITLTANDGDVTILVFHIGPDMEPVGSAATPVATEIAATPAPATPEPEAEPETPEATPEVEEVDEPQDIDSDGDGIDNSDEIARGTDPDSPDTDEDGLEDSEELLLGTDPLVVDSDDDGITDGDEVQLGTDPLNSDTDGDLLYDDGERIYGTDPLVQDTDGDGILDGDEVYVTGTDPTLFDTDGDGASDLEEINAGTDPLDATVFP